jgi:hypothetical protein
MARLGCTGAGQLATTGAGLWARHLRLKKLGFFLTLFAHGVADTWALHFETGLLRNGAFDPFRPHE